MSVTSSSASRPARGAALLSFINVLVVSLLALIPGDHIGWTAIAGGLVGELYAAASVVALEEDRRPDADPGIRASMRLLKRRR
jgi:hypothetical protein